MGPKDMLAIAAKIATSLVAAAVAAFAVYLLMVGVPWHFTSGDTPPTTRVEYRPHQVAVIPLASAVLVFMGLWRRQQPLAWGGVLLLAVIGGLTVWSVGIPFLGAACLLSPLLALSHRLPFVTTAALSLPALAFGYVLLRGRV